METASASLISIFDPKFISVDKSNLEFPDTLGTWHFGRGYNSLSGGKAGYCVVNTEPKSIIPNNNAQKVYFEISKISSTSELVKKFSLEASANIRFGIGDIGGKASFVNETKINNYSVYLLIKIEVRNGEKSFENDIDFKPTAFQLLEKSPEDFFKRCGDEYVEGISTGAEFYALLEIETDSMDKQKFVNASLKGTYGLIFGGSTQFSSSLLNIMTTHSTKLRIYQVGGVVGDNFRTTLRDGSVIEGIRLPQDPDELIRYAAEFPSKVTLENSRPIFARTSRYDHLLNIPLNKNFYDIKNQQDVLNYLGKIADRLKENLANIEYISNNPNQFMAFDPAVLEKARLEISLEINKITEYASKCIRDYNCVFPTDLIDSSYTIPERKKFHLECEMRESKICGVKRYKSGRDLICGVQEYLSGEDESCGVETFKTARSEHCNPETFKTSTGPVCGIEHYNSRANGAICGMETYRTCKRGFLGFGHSCNDNRRPKTCEHPSFGVASYKSCSNPEFGVSIWELCSDTAHGVEKYKSCPNPKFGIKEFNLCENELFGVSEYNTCLLEKGKDQICSNPEME